MKQYPGGHPSLDESELWQRVIQEKRAIIRNEFNNNELPKDHPENHPSIQRTLLVPVMRSNTVIAILGVGNKSHLYGDEDIRLLSALADIAWDIVARKRAEEAAENIQAALTHSQKMEMVGQLAGGIAHDFNNMLGLILGHTELALEQEDPTHSFHTDLKAIRLAATRSAELTRQLLAFARKQTIIPKILELNSVVEGMLSMLRRLIGEEITLCWIPGRHSTLVRIDPTQIDQILVNLCVNARDSITQSGKITITTGSLHVESATSTPPLTGMVDDDYVTLSVTDNGCGIQSKDLPHIFEPFFTTKEQGKGTGLGLSTIYGIVKQNNGYIDFQSEQGKGSRFIIFLPRHSYHLSGERSEATCMNLHCGKESILLVEDEPDIMKLCKLMLENQGYTVLAVTAPNEALRIARKHQGEIQLLLTDVVMPQMNGNDLSKKLLRIWPELKTLFMSGYTAEVIANHGVMNQDVSFIQKPFSINGLIKKVHETLKGEEV